MAESFNLFERFGVEMEYMIVDAKTLNILPIADRILHTAGTERKNEIRHGNLRWSNELVRHVVELKTDGPVTSLQGLEGIFQQGVCEANAMLASEGACLLPGGMHPWMDPLKETVLWPHDNREIYDAFNRIFDCRGHGWSNLQSTHLNLSFCGDDQFRRLHSAIRLVLPLLPVLAASSPFVEGRVSRVLDMRLEVYRSNCAKIPSITGHVVPEQIQSREQYEAEILQRIYRDISPLDPDGILQDEWVNARGAIARFERGAIEIRVLDNQECPRMDLAIVQFIERVLRRLVAEEWVSVADQEGPGCVELEELFVGALRAGMDTPVGENGYRESLGIESKNLRTLGQVLWHLFEKTGGAEAPGGREIEFILRHGNLSRRLLRAAGGEVSAGKLHGVYGELAKCLQDGRMFL